MALLFQHGVLGAKSGPKAEASAQIVSNVAASPVTVKPGPAASVPQAAQAKRPWSEADDNFTPNAKAKLKVTLLDGAELSGSVAADCDLFGYNSLGRFTTFYHRLRSVRFE